MATVGPEQTPDNTDTDHAGVLAPPPIIHAGTVLLAVALNWVIPLQFLTEDLRFGIGVPLAVLSIVLALAAIRRFRKAGTNVPPWQPATAIVEAGPYRFTRNPMYLGLTGLYLGIGLMVGSLWFLVLFPPLIIVMRQGVILREEAYLERKFGAGYTSYKARVRRWI